MKVLQAEYESLQGYLREKLSPEQLGRPLLVSFSQWEISTSVSAELSAQLHRMGCDVTVALWADHTPLRDVGWTTSHRVSRLLFSPARDQRLIKALRSFGLPASAFPPPPIRKWRPQAKLPTATDLTRSAIRSLTYRDSPMGRAILQVHPDNETPISEAYLWPPKWIQACMNSYAYAYDQTDQLLKERASSALIVFNGRFLHDAAAVAAAQSHGIPVLSFDYGGNESDYDVTVDATHDWPALQTRMRNLYARWDPHERDEIGSRWFIQRRQHKDARNALFVESQTVGRGIDLPRDRRIVVFFSSSGDEISELDVEWSEYFHGQENALAAVAEICKASDEHFVVVRTHPHKRMKSRRDVADWHAAVASCAPDLHLDEWSNVDSYTLMDQADVVITYGSTTGVEAAFNKKPVIVLGPSAYDELGCAVRVRDEDELRRALQTLDPGRWEGAVSYGLMMNRRGFMNEFLLEDSARDRMSKEEICDARPTALKISHWLGTRQWRRLARVDGKSPEGSDDSARRERQ